MPVMLSVFVMINSVFSFRLEMNFEILLKRISNFSAINMQVRISACADGTTISQSLSGNLNIFVPYFISS